MKNIRVFFTKTGRMKFVSHLDMSRFMARVIRRADIPIWYTEGYNPHPYINFALPLSLGYESRFDMLDIRVTDDGISCEEIGKRLSAVMPKYVHILSVAEPITKAANIAFARFEIVFDTENKELLKQLNAFINQDEILCSKKTKKGVLKEIDLAPKIKQKNLSGNTLMLLLPAGPTDNINPSLLIDAFFEQYEGEYVCFSVARTEILDANFNLFR